MMRHLLVIAVFGVALPFTGCASLSDSAGPESTGTHPAWLTGTWQGSGWQIDSAKEQGAGQLTVTFAPDGAWRASTPTGVYSGTSSLIGDRVVLDGVAPDGAKIRYILKEREGAGGYEMWGLVQATFGSAMLSLKRVP
jgi:hypothetical protein